MAEGEETIKLDFDVDSARRSLQEIQQQIQQTGQQAVMGAIGGVRGLVTGLGGAAAAGAGEADGTAMRMAKGFGGGFMAGAAQPTQPLAMAGVSGVMGAIGQIPVVGGFAAAALNRFGVGQLTSVQQATAGRVGGVTAQLARMGIDVPIEETQKLASVVAAQEMRAFNAKREAGITAAAEVLTADNIKEAFESGFKSFGQEIGIYFDRLAGLFTPSTG